MGFNHIKKNYSGKTGVLFKIAEHKIMKQSTEIKERVSVFEATIDKLDVMIKECKSVEAQTEEKEKEEHDAQLREKKYDEEMQFKKPSWSKSKNT